MNQVHESARAYIVGIQTSARGARVAKLNRVEHTQAHICANVCEERIEPVILRQRAFLIPCKAFHSFSFQASLLLADYSN